jgi:hypothetical protein
MPDRLTLQATLVLVAVALGLAFAVQVLVGAGASATMPTAQRGPALVQSLSGSALDLELRAAQTVPALRAPRKGRVQPLRATRIGRDSTTSAVTLVSAPVAPAESARPTPTAVPRDVALPSPRAVSAPKPKQEPIATSTPDGGGFDTTGIDTTGDFDTSG